MTRFLAGLALTASCVISSAPAQAVQPVSPGGSNYAWYDLTASTQPAPPGPNCREPFGVLKNYQNPGVRAIVQGQLAQMRANGQHRLRIPIFHRNNAQGGTLLRSNGGNLSSHDRTSLALFLSDVNVAGFSEILVGFFPIGPNSPLGWTSWNEPMFQENWNLIYNLRPLIAGAGIQYRIDLMNEGAPASHQTQLRQYVWKLWINYNLRFGKADTVGFSVAAGTSNPLDTATVVNRYNTTRDIYDSTSYGPPYLWDVHLYDSPGLKLQALDQAMNARGDSSSLIIGETFYDDAATWSAIQSTYVSRTVWHIYQWPLTPNRGCDGHVDITPPTQYRYW
ncbi:MAG: hypothetical protein AAGE94_03635 [Acidobacteriota bacterium]